MNSDTPAPSEFPDILIPDSEKKEMWHKQAVLAITNRSLNSSYSINYASMNESVNFFQGLQTGDEYRFLQEAEDGDVLPAKWMNLNKIRPKLSIVLGEFMERGFDIQVKAINKAAISRKLEEKERLRVEMWLQEPGQMLESQLQLPLASQEELPETEADLEHYMTSTYKETSEIVMESALKWLSEYFDWEYTRFELVRDILIQGRMFARVELVNGIPKIRRVDPRLMIFDGSAQDDFLTDSTYFGEVRYRPLSEIREKYKLTSEEVEKLRALASKGKLAANYMGGNVATDSAVGVNNQIVYSKQEGGELKILTLEAYWKDTAAFNHKISVDNYGTEHIRKVGDKAESDKVEKRRIEVWRKGTLLGGEILKDWGLLDDRATSVDNLGITYPPYVSCIPFYMNQVGVSITQLLKPLQDLKNITMYNIQLAMSRAGAKGIMYDISQLPEGLEIEQVLKYLKVFGIGVFDSKRDGMAAGYNQFAQYDLSLSESVSQYLAIMDLVDREMDSISGINEARQGISQGASQAVGVTQSALFQSNFATAPIMKLFRMAASKCLAQQARLVKIAWADKEKFAAIIGDTGVDFLSQDIELDLNDYGVFVDEIPPILEDVNMFREFVMAAVQSGGLQLIDGLKLLQEKDIKVAIKQFERITIKREMEAAKAQEAQARQEQEAMMQQQQMIAQQQEAANQSKLQLEGVRGQNLTKNTLLKGKLDLTGKKLDLLK